MVIINLIYSRSNQTGVTGSRLGVQHRREMQISGEKPILEGTPVASRVT
jgi:hypothetical protein